MVTVVWNIDAAAEKIRADRHEEALALVEFKIRGMRQEIIDLIQSEDEALDLGEFDRGYVPGLELSRGIIEHWCHEYLFQRGEGHGRIIAGKKARDIDSGEQGVAEDHLSNVQRIKEE